MSEKIDDRKIFSLLEVTKSIQKTLSDRYTSSFWVKAEMNRLNPHPPSGHCYPELVEKKDGKIIAEISANLWRDDFNRINKLFLQVLKEPLKNGIRILFSAQVAYDPVYGLRLRILDIDPAYSLGELEREKQETLDRLRKDGIYDANRSLTMPQLPQRIAIISVETSKGYSDFVKTLANNPWGYAFFHMTFPAILQGERSVDSIISQLRTIKKVMHHFDTVAIIRGGGGEVGLTSYNNYSLAAEIALFPIPVITGIGHSTNETVAEMIAFKNAITPTDLADYLLQRFHNFSVPVHKARDTIAAQSRRILKDEKLRLLNAVRYFKSTTGSTLIKKNNDIHTCIRMVRQLSAQTIQAKRQQIGLASLRLSDRSAVLLATAGREIRHIEKTIILLDPDNVLKRGYSITLKDGKAVNKTEDLKDGDRIDTILSDGNVTSIVHKRVKREQKADNQHEPKI